MKKFGFRCYYRDKTNFGIYQGNNDNIKLNDWVLVKFKGNTIDIGKIVYIPKCETFSNNNKTLDQNDMPLILKHADESDIKQKDEALKFSREAVQKCYEQIKNHKLPMFLLDSHLTLDKSKLTFYFSANGRIDFRDLVKDLAPIFKTRIELFQVGVRDESKRIGGIGVCGRAVCCSTFLYDFTSVTIKMAKNQNLNLTPSKISGICGRLLCCLSYENDFYIDQLKKFPPQNCMFKVNENIGKIINFNVITSVITYSINNGYTKEMGLDEFLKNFGNGLIYSKQPDKFDDEGISEELKKLEEE